MDKHSQTSQAGKRRKLGRLLIETGMIDEATLQAALEHQIIPTILLTGEGELDSEAASFDAGADDYLMKPIDPKRPVFRVNRLIKKTANSE